MSHFTNHQPTSSTNAPIVETSGDATGNSLHSLFKFLGSLPFSLLIVNRNREIEFANSCAAGLVGYSRKELAGLHVKTLLPRRLRRGALRELRLWFAQPHQVGVWQFDVEVMHQHRGEISVELTLGAIRDGPSDLVVISLTDMTDRIQARQSLEKSEATLRDIVNNTSAVVYIKDLAGRYKLVNRRFASLFDMTQENVQGKTDYEVFPLDLATKFRENDQHVVDTQCQVELEEVAPHEDGPHTYISSKFPLRDANGTIYAVAGISTDITDRLARHEAEQQLQTAQAVQKVLFPDPLPTLATFDMAAAVYPYHMLCGDYLDAIQVDEHRMLLIVGDVSGHGLGPAMEMVETRAYLRAIVATQGTNVNLIELARSLNGYLCADLEDSSFVTMFLALIDACGDTAVCFGAGHEALLTTADGSQRITSGGAVLGIIEEYIAEPEQTVSLAEGSVLTILTDGVFEAMAAGGTEQFGMDGVAQSIAAHRHEPSSQIVASLKAEVDRFTVGARLTDDFTVAVVKRTSPSQSNIAATTGLNAANHGE